MYTILYEGVKLMFFGMSIVFVYLLIMIGIIHLTSRLLKTSTQKELDELNYQREQARLRQERKVVAKPSIQEETDETLIAVISAAIAHHRSSNSSL